MADKTIVFMRFINQLITGGPHPVPNVFRKQPWSHSSSVLKLSLVDGPSWQSYFGDGAFSQYKGVFNRATVLESFGCFMLMSASVKWYERLQFEGSQPMKTMSIRFVFN